MPDKRRRPLTTDELDRAAEITPDDIERAKERVRSPLLRRLLDAEAVDAPDQRDQG